jgi:hypothetical protein
MPGPIVILGVFVADTAYRAPRPPRMGETIMGESFALGPGGKGSNQACAAAKAGAGSISSAASPATPSATSPFAPGRSAASPPP